MIQIVIIATPKPAVAPTSYEATVVTIPVEEYLDWVHQRPCNSADIVSANIRGILS